MKRMIALSVALVLVAACESSRLTDSDPTDTATVAPTFTGTDTTPPTTVEAPPTSVADTTSTSTTTGECVPDGDVDKKGDPDPLTLSGMYGMDIRTGSHPCYERIVIELGGTGDFPGWAVEYVDDPVRLGESDEFAEIAGDATLFVRMGMWMTTMEGGGYQGEIDIFPVGVSHILELRQTENFEGMCIWSIGLDAQYPFTASVFHDPERLVIDIQVPAGP